MPDEMGNTAIAYGYAAASAPMTPATRCAAEQKLAHYEVTEFKARGSRRE